MATMQDEAGSHNAHTIPGLIRELREEGIVLVRQEIELAKTELSEKAGRVARNSVYVGVGSAGTFAGVLFLLAAATGALSIGLVRAGMGEWATPLAAAIVGIVAGIAGAVVARKGKRAVTNESPLPEKMIESLKEDRRWAEAKLRAGDRE